MEMTAPSPQPALNEGETLSGMMFYTADSIVWGKMPHHETLMPSRVLTGVTIPEILSLYDAQAMFVGMNFVAKPVKQAHMMIPTSTVLGYHLQPPTEDQIDYDPTEPNRRMAPVSLYIGPFLVKGSMRISEISSVKATLEAMKATYLSLYDLQVSQPHNPKMPPIKMNQGYFQTNALIVEG